MGAADNYYITVQSDKSSLIEKHNQVVDAHQYEYGHGGYTGTWAESSGLEVKHRVFETQDEAYDWLQNAIRKWEPDIAVRFKGEDGGLIYMVGGCHSE